MKSVREQMDMIAAYGEVGSLRGAAEICGVRSHRTPRSAISESRVW